MKILVTGGAGYVGSVLVKNLLQKNYSVRVLDRMMLGGESLLAFLENPKLEVVAEDMRKTAVVEKALEDIDSVVHLAALVGDPACRRDPKITQQINVEAVKLLASTAKKKGVKHFIFSSTCSNYGLSDVAKLATEEDALHPLSLYAETKIEAEKYLLTQVSGEFTITIMRLATIFGLSPRMRFDLMVNEAAREVALGGSFSVRNENAWRPYLHTQDVSAAFIAVLQAEKKDISGQIFNIVGENIQKKDLLELAKKHNPSMKFSVENGLTDDKRDYRVSSEKFRKIIGWSSQHTIKDSFSEMVGVVRKGIFLDPYEFRYNGLFDEKIFS